MVVYLDQMQVKFVGKVISQSSFTARLMGGVKVGMHITVVGAISTEGFSSDYRHECATEWAIGQWVMGQMGRHTLMGHVGHINNNYKAMRCGVVQLMKFEVDAVTRTEKLLRHFLLSNVTTSNLT